MAAPVVQSVQDIVAQLQAAYKPQLDQIDTGIAANDAAGTAQTAGIEAKKDTAFNTTIPQAAQNRGMFFSGFSPNEQAKYTGSTYLPALAALQGKIADVRNTLLGKKADISSQANTQGISLHSSQQSAYDQWQQQEEARAAAERQHAADQAFQASENAKNRASSASIAASNRAASNPAPGHPGTDVLAYFGNQLKAGGALTNKNAKVSRQAQDSWVQKWFLDNGVLDPGAQTQVWNLVNATYHRPNDPTKDWLYKR